MKIKGFTLMELMIVVVIIGIMAGFSLPQYQKAVRKSHERDAVIQLSTIHAANTMFRAVNSQFWGANGVNQNLAQINAGLNLNVIANGMTYTYTRLTTTTFTARAAWTGTGGNFTVEVDEAAIDNANPSCVVGPCPSL